MTLSCSPRLEKLSLFSPPPPCAKSMAQGFRCLRAAIRATRPEPRQHFWKIAGSKNFLFLCSAQMTQPIFHPANSLYVWQAFYCFMWNNALGKPIACDSANCSLGYHPNPVRQIRFALCLCAVRQWLCCPNWLWIFLRFRFFWIFSVFRMVNSSSLCFS